MPRLADTADLRLCLTDPLHPQPGETETKPAIQSRAGVSSAGLGSQTGTEQSLLADGKTSGRTGLPPGLDSSLQARLQLPGAHTASPRFSLTANLCLITRTRRAKRVRSGRKGGSLAGPLGQPGLEQDLLASVRMTGRADLSPGPDPSRETDLQRQRANTAGLLPPRRPASLR